MSVKKFKQTKELLYGLGLTEQQVKLVGEVIDYESSKYTLDALTNQLNELKDPETEQIKKTVTIEEIESIKDTAERQKMMAENWHLYENN